MAPLTTGAIKAILQEISQQSAGRGRYARGAAAYTGASGGVISDYLTPPGTVYRAHIFTSSGTFDVTSALPGGNVDVLLVGGGGGGGGYGGGGGGGAVIHVQAFPRTIGSYPIVVAAGGAGRPAPGPTGPATAQPSNEGGTSSVFGYSATGGGAAGAYQNTPATAGANGGGQGAYLGPPGTPQGVAGVAPTVPAPLSPYATVYAGNRGGTFGSSDPPWGDFPSGGGAGAGGNGGTVLRGSVGGAGGNGQVVNIIPSPPSINSGNGYIWGGGGGGSIYDTTGTGGVGGPGGGGGGADGPSPGGSGGLNVGGNGGPYIGGNGGESTGGGGGGSSYGTNGSYAGGNGGSGIVVVRYALPASTGTARATGGSISYYGGKTIHTFTSSGTFATAPNWTATNVEYVVIGGGGSGGGKTYISGGGGAGSYRTGTTPIGAHPVSTTIQVGAGGVLTSLSSGGSGTESYFGIPITAPGGGYGGTYPNPGIGGPGGSGGGGAASSTPGAGGPATGAPFPGTIGATPAAGWGHNGGDSNASSPAYGAGGGGGAGGVGSNGSPTLGGNGGVGIQLPATFRNPVSTVGAPGPTSPPFSGADTSGKYWVAGGGGGSTYPTGSPGSSGGAGGGGAGGAGANGGDGVVNTGSGGGGSEREPGPATQSGRGGSGIVIIAYPT